MFPRKTNVQAMVNEMFFISTRFR